jgi:hypothetical protein
MLVDILQGQGGYYLPPSDDSHDCFQELSEIVGIVLHSWGVGPRWDYLISYADISSSPPRIYSLD